MLFLLTPMVCKVISGKVQQRFRYPTYCASAARYLAGRCLRLQASESAYCACWRTPVWWYFRLLLLPTPASAMERDGDIVSWPARQLVPVADLGVSCYCWPCIAPVLPPYTVSA